MNNIHNIGTKLFPLGERRAEKRVFTFDTTKKIVDEDLAALMREVHRQRPFAAGFCYSVTEQVVKNAVANGWPYVQFFSGWLMIDDAKPLHHAWAVSGSYVIDFTNVFCSPDLIEDFDREMKPRADAARAGDADAWIEWAVLWRRLWLERLQPYEAGDIIENRVWGQVPRKFTYVGCPSDQYESRQLFQRWHKKYGEGSDGPGEMSPIQQIEQALRTNGEAGIRMLTEKLKAQGLSPSGRKLEDK